MPVAREKMEVLRKIVCVSWCPTTVVRSPVVSLALYNAIMDEVKDTRGSVGLHGVWACDDEKEWLDVSEVAFVDMLSFLAYDTDDEAELRVESDRMF